MVDMEQQPDWLRETLREMKTEMKEGFSEVRRDTAEIKTRVALVEQDLKNIAGKQDGEIQERKELEKRVDALEKWKWYLMGGVSVASVLISGAVSLLLKVFGI